MKRRRLRKEPAALEVMGFINLIVVLVPFLLSTAVFSRLAVMELQLPAGNAVLDQVEPGRLQLEVVVRRDALEVGDRVGGLIQRIERDGAEIKVLSGLLVQIKSRFPEQRDASLLAEADTSYDDLVQVMDTLRATVTADGARIVRAELFPSVSIGDAPLRGGGDAALRAGASRQAVATAKGAS